MLHILSRIAIFCCVYGVWLSHDVFFRYILDRSIEDFFLIKTLVIFYSMSFEKFAYCAYFFFLPDLYERIVGFFESIMKRKPPTSALYNSQIKLQDE